MNRNIFEGKANRAMRRMGTVTMSLMIMFSMMPLLGEATDGFAGAVSVYADTTAYDAELTFKDDAITEDAAGSGYTISGTTLTIKSAGTYRIGGSCSEGSIEVKKGLSDVVLVEHILYS